MENSNSELIEKIREIFLKKLDDYHKKVPHYKHYGEEGCGMDIKRIKKTLDEALTEAGKVI